ncbi:hypothetical protein PUR29_33270 [Methylobacterium ajmalii]|uniref:Uncharacterized protein n=1 Tax=Methylobacterium ajmalii TaxID=2738439 RepID=A0ABV0A3G9_9HYPH
MSSRLRATGADSEEIMNNFKKAGDFVDHSLSVAERDRLTTALRQAVASLYGDQCDDWLCALGNKGAEPDYVDEEEEVNQDHVRIMCREIARIMRDCEPYERNRIMDGGFSTFDRRVSSLFEKVVPINYNPELDRQGDLFLFW